MNGGGIRFDSLPGNITYGNTISTLPFGNTLCKIETTGQTLLDALEMASQFYPQLSGAFLHPSGLTYEIRSDITASVSTDEEGNFVSVDGLRRVQNVRIKDKPIDPARLYTVTAGEYLLKHGSDGLTMFKDSKVLVDEQGLDYEASISSFKDNLNGVISADSVYANEYSCLSFTVRWRQHT